jgi:hypothetical protein
MDFDALVTQAEAEQFFGWDFSWLRGRRREGHTSWDFGAMVREWFVQADPAANYLHDLLSTRSNRERRQVSRSATVGAETAHDGC